jgi:ATP-dependent Clp protease ATP-binding subunit ClpA
VLVFERFNDEARRVVVLAKVEARLRNHNFIGTEHLLLGLIREDQCVAAKVLESLEISLPVARADIGQIVGHGDQTRAGHMPFTPPAKKALELSEWEAFQLGEAFIGTEHLLLGLIREGEGVAAQVLVRLGADLSRTRQQVTQLRPGDAVRIQSLLVQRDCGRQPMERESRMLPYDPRTLGAELPVRMANLVRQSEASGLRGLPGDLAYLRASLFKRADNSD